MSRGQSAGGAKRRRACPDLRGLSRPNSGMLFIGGTVVQCVSGNSVSVCRGAVGRVQWTGNTLPMDQNDAESANTPQDVMLNALHPSPLGGEIKVARSASRSFGMGCSVGNGHWQVV